jgi:hypothetical protein
MSSIGDAVVRPPAELVQVWFPMSGGPAAALGMGAEALSPNRVRLPSAPWAALNAAKGDIFRVQQEMDGKLWAQEKLEAPGYCAIRLVLASDSPLGPLNVGTEAILEKCSPDNDGTSRYCQTGRVGKRDEKVYERNQWVKLRKRRADSNLVDLGRYVVHAHRGHVVGDSVAGMNRPVGRPWGKVCGVPVEKRPGYSWASPSSIGSVVNVGTTRGRPPCDPARMQVGRPVVG